MNKIISSFYLIRLDGAPIYVGYTNRDIKTRFREHKRDKDFGNAKITVESIGTLEYTFTWDLGLINQYAREVADRETELIEKYSTQDSFCQKGTKVNLGGQTWNDIKYFIRTNSNNPIFSGVDGGVVIEMLEWQHEENTRLTSIINNTKYVGHVSLTGVIRHTIPEGQARLESAIRGTKPSESVRLVSSITSTKPAEQTRLENTIRHTIPREQARLENYIRKTKTEESVRLSGNISNTRLTEEVRLGGIISVTKPVEQARIESIIGNTKPTEQIRLRNNVGNTR